MAKVFPHVGNDAFPHLGNAQPFARKVPFDYGRYDYTATIKLCCVPWPMDYKHVVNWPNATARDLWFDRLAGHVIELDNGFTRTQTDSIRVNVPYDEALTYNYVYMQVPPLTQDDHIDNEGATGLRTVCAWIQDAVYQSPSVTELILTVDVWSTYLPHLADTTLMLHRGHAPAYETTVDDYLSNPKANCADLLTPDVSYGTPDIVASSDLLDIADGAKMVVIASTIPYYSIESLTLSQANSGDTSAAGFYDTGARNGHQVGVTGYEWHYGGRSYDGMRNPSAYGAVDDAMISYTYLYAIPAAYAANSLTSLAATLPQFIKSVQAAYILPRRALTLASTPYQVGGVTLYKVIPSVSMHDLASIDLTKGAFGYPARYAEITKLYTYPYAQLIISDTLGNDVVMRVEDVGASPKVTEQISPMAECLRWDVIISGVNDAGQDTYTWVALDGSTRTMQLPGADLARYTIELGIPTYAIYLDGRVAHAMNTYQDGMTQRASAINAYQSSMRSANNERENAWDSATTAKANADASADTGKTNADASANTSVTNTANSGRNSQANATVQNNLRTTSTSRTNTASADLRDTSNAHIFNTLNADLEYTMGASDINLKSEAVAGALSTVGALASGNIAGAVSNGVSAVVNITTSAALADLSMYNIIDKEGIGQLYQTDSTAAQMDNATDQAGYANTANSSITNNNVNTANANATSTANTAKANATRTQATSKGNASRSEATSKNNASYGRATSEENAKNALELARLNYERAGRAGDMDNPLSFGLASGDRAPDALMRRVLQVRVETQSKSAISRAGDMMLRYGYIYDGLWQVDSWCPTGHDGCYWEATDILVNANEIDNPTAERTYESILLQGVTVWNDPSKIGGLPW